MKKLLSSLLLCAMFMASPLIMDHAKDIYLEEIVSKKAMPVSHNITRTFGSSFQVKYKGKRLTVTNNHVCSVVEEIQRRQKSKDYAKAMKDLDKSGIKRENYNLYRSIKGLLQMIYKVDHAFPILGQSLKIGNLNRKILYNSPNHDICFLEPVGDKYFSLASYVHRGEAVTIIGHPRGMAQSISDGRIVGEGVRSFPWLPDAGRVKFLRSTALSYPGNSGSPVVNRYGNVVGILFMGWSADYVNINGIVPLDALKSELESFLSK